MGVAWPIPFRMNNTLLDNSEKFLMRDTLRRFIGSGKYDRICIATGYWDLPGTNLVFDELKAFLEDGGRLEILIGQEPQLRSYQTRTPETDEERFPDFYLQRDINLLTDEYRPIAELIQQYCNVQKYECLLSNAEAEEDQDNSPIQIRVYGQKDPARKQFLHAKCYIFLGAGEADGIIGSSNFTQKGLEDNAELNYLETQNSIITASFDEHSNSKSHKVWFEEKWAQSVPWNGKFLQILSAAPVGQPKPEPEPEPTPEDIAPLTPYELYIKLLQTKFGAMVDKNLGEMIESYLPEKYDTYDYQIDAVKQCFSTMKEHGGFMLADVVGLGKTIVGTLLIKHFLQFPDEDGRDAKVLVVTPPAIQSAWKNTIADFDGEEGVELASHIDFITTGSIGKLTDDADDNDDDDVADTGEFNEELKQENYGLIIIDESHKFRNSGTAMYEAIDNLIAQIGANTGCYPYIGLLSATPQNNRPSDLQNQIYLFERNHAESTLKKIKGGNLEGFFADINRRYAAIIHTKTPDGVFPKEQQDELKKLSAEIRDCVLTDIMVRRTRTDVQKYYAEDMKRQGIKFPMIKGPISLEYRMSPTLARLFYDSMQCISPDEFTVGGLKYYRYRAIQFMTDPENKRKYNARGSRDADTLAEQLAHIMQINLVKRLESSFTAFKQSLMNLRQYTKNMIDMWEHDAIFICPDFDVNAELDRKTKEKKRGHKVDFEECFKDIRNHITKLDEEGRNELKNNAEYQCSDFDPAYIEYLREEYDTINDLCERWAMNSEDPKFDEFKENLRPVLFNAETNTPQKLVVFTEAIDTADSIVAAAKAKGYRVLKITAANRNEMEQTIRENFDANYGNNPKRPEEVRKNDYDMIVTTDVLAEGINLHRANCILNYDTPWNSTRLMQRIGRVNRIGSTCDNVYVYNFMPSAQGDAEIKLVQKAHTKLQSFHTLFGEDSQVFSDSEEVMHYDLNTEVNGPESPLEKYVYELKQYKDAHPERYAQIEAATEGLQLAVAGDGVSAYFLVRTPRMSGMFVRVDKATGKGHIISPLEMYEGFKPEVETIAIELPGKWASYCKAAEKAVNQQLNKMNTRMGNSTNATKAKEILIKMRAEQQMSDASRDILDDAFSLVNKGNNDIIKKILAFEDARHDRELTFWALTQEDFDAMVEQEVSRIVATVQKRYGKAEVFVGLAK